MNRSKTRTLLPCDEDLPTKTALGGSWAGGSLPSSCASTHIHPLAFSEKYPNKGVRLCEMPVKEPACGPPRGDGRGWAGEARLGSGMQVDSVPDSFPQKDGRKATVWGVCHQEQEIASTPSMATLLLPRHLSGLLGEEENKSKTREARLMVMGRSTQLCAGNH